jgi:hypothetical protein
MAQEVVEHFTDNYGKVVGIGTLVAYNYSGQVAKGVVKRILRKKRESFSYSSTTTYKYTIEINHIDSMGRVDEKHVSKVTNRYNLIAL